MKLCEVIKIGSEKEIRVLGVPVAEFGCRSFNENKSYEKYFDIFPSKGLREEFFDGILSQLNGDYDDIYIYRMATMGDIYFFSFMIENWIKKNNSKNPVLVVLKDNAKQVFKLFSLNIDCVQANFDRRLALDIFSKDIDNNGFLYKNKRFFSYINKQIILNAHQDANNCIQASDKKCSFIYHLAKYYAPFDSSVVSNLISHNISDVQKGKLKESLKNLGVNIDKFVLLSPEASSNCNYDVTFWIELCRELKNKGYDIFINSTSNKWQIPNCVYGLYDIEQTYYLAQLSKGIISLRSGFNDILSTVDVPQHILYTKFKCNVVDSAEKNIKQFSLKYLPGVNEDNIFEYDTEHLSEYEIKRMILERLNK